MSDYNPLTIAGETASGAAVGTEISPGYGTLIGGALGLGAGLIGGALTPSYDDIYGNLMSQFYGSPEYAQEKAALAQLQGQTVAGPTAQEKAALLQAYNSANQQFNNQYGSIRDRLARTQGLNSSTEAALLASSGAGEDNQMSSMATNAAAQEDARRQSAIQAYNQATAQSMQMQDQYREWASGQATQKNASAQAASSGAINSAMSLVGSTAAYLNKPQQPFNLGAYQVANGQGQTPLSSLPGANGTGNLSAVGSAPSGSGDFGLPPTAAGMYAPFQDTSNNNYGPRNVMMPKAASPYG